MNKQRSEDIRRGLIAGLPMRVRITLWVLAILAVVHVTLAVVLLLFFRQSARETIEADLREAASYVAGAPKTSSLADVRDAMQDTFQVHRWAPIDVGFVRKGDQEAEWVGQLGSEAHGAMSARVFDQAPELHAEELDDLFYAAVRLRNGDSAIVAVSRDRLDEAVMPVGLALLIALPVGLLSTGIATWFMAGAAIRPLVQVQRFAEDLSTENLMDDVDLGDTAPEIEELRDELEAAMSRISAGYDRQARFLANVSHELKTPISVIRTEAQVMLSGTGANEEELRGFARSTEEEMDRLGRMVESFLLLTRIREGTARVRAKCHDANDLLMETVTQNWGMAKQHGVPINPTLYDGDDELMIEGNADLIQTTIGNLVRNAIRFSPQGTFVDVSVNLDGEDARFDIRDHGPGIPDALIDRIFEPFTQADEERQRGRGTGLGLQIAQGIAELHGGSIVVQNLERGCQFSLRLPISGADNAPPSI